RGADPVLHRMVRHRLSPWRRSQQTGDHRPRTRWRRIPVRLDARHEMKSYDGAEAIRSKSVPPGLGAPSLASHAADIAGRGVRRCTSSVPPWIVELVRLKIVLRLACEVGKGVVEGVECAAGRDAEADPLVGC